MKKDDVLIFQTTRAESRQKQTTANNKSKNIVNADIYVLYAHHYKIEVTKSIVFFIKRKETKQKKANRHKDEKVLHLPVFCFFFF